MLVITEQDMVLRVVCSSTEKSLFSMNYSTRPRGLNFTATTSKKNIAIIPKGNRCEIYGEAAGDKVQLCVSRRIYSVYNFSSLHL